MLLTFGTFSVLYTISLNFRIDDATDLNYFDLLVLSIHALGTSGYVLKTVFFVKLENEETKKKMKKQKRSARL